VRLEDEGGVLSGVDNERGKYICIAGRWNEWIDKAVCNLKNNDAADDRNT
jgi:hypothetical protein